ncbi:hypothetical protein [Streptomyces achromogenes]|uniref:hypothetical protein n=1 Tax=Streptomyces achromogenes TaxID=67255 RepID=UPI0033C993DF
MAVATYAWSGRERLGLLRVGDDVLVLHAARRPGEIRDPTQLLPPPTEVCHKEIAGALALMDTMTVDRLEGPEFTDRYTGAIARIIEARREEKPRCCSPRRSRHRPGAAYGSTPAAERTRGSPYVRTRAPQQPQVNGPGRLRRAVRPGPARARAESRRRPGPAGVHPVRANDQQARRAQESGPYRGREAGR